MGFELARGSSLGTGPSSRAPQHGDTSLGPVWAACPFAASQLPARMLQTAVSLAQALILSRQRPSEGSKTGAQKRTAALSGWPRLSDCCCRLAQRDGAPATLHCGLCPGQSTQAGLPECPRGERNHCAGATAAGQPCLCEESLTYHCVQSQFSFIIDQRVSTSIIMRHMKPL